MRWRFILAVLVAILAISGVALGVGVPGALYMGRVALEPHGHRALRFKAYPHHLSHFHSTRIPLRCNRGAAKIRIRPIEAVRFDNSGRFRLHYESAFLEPGNGTPVKTDRFTLRGRLVENKAHGIFKYSLHKRSGKHCRSGKLHWTAARH